MTDPAAPAARRSSVLADWWAHRGPAARVGTMVALALPLGALLGASVTSSVAALGPSGLVWGAAAIGALGGLAGALLAGAVLARPRSIGLPLTDKPAGPAAVSSGDVRDALTGAYTQRHFVAAADREWARLRRHDEDAALLMIDIDGLQALNERRGQDCGDAALVDVTRLVSATLRHYDLLARFGGGVLVAYLPHTDPIGALDVAERIRERVANWRLSWQGESVNATVSVGVAPIGADHPGLDAVIADAGNALRAAKTAGRNCVRSAPVPPKRNPAPGLRQGQVR